MEFLSKQKYKKATLLNNKIIYIIINYLIFSLSLQGDFCAYELPFQVLQQKMLHGKHLKEAFSKTQNTENIFITQFNIIYEDNENIALEVKHTQSTNCSKQSQEKNNQLHDSLMKTTPGQFPQNLQNYMNSHTNFRAPDSEFQFLSNLSTYDFNGINIEKNIKRIEFHGFTTRDMCPWCFAHISMFYNKLKAYLDSYNAWKSDFDKNDYTAVALKNLMTKLYKLQWDQNVPSQPITFSFAIQLAFYISSSIQLGLQEFDGSIYPSYAGTTYNNSVKNITKFYPQNEQSEGGSPTEGIFCTFIRDDNPNWSLQYYAPSQQKQWQTKNISFPNNASTLSAKVAEQIKCSLNNGQTNCSFCNHKGKLKCSIHSEGRVTPGKYTITIPTSNIIYDGTFRNLISPWITQEVFSFAKAKANTIIIQESPLSIESTDLTLNAFLNPSN